MKKLALLAALSGVLVVGAFAQTGPPASGTVTLSIQSYTAVAFVSSDSGSWSAYDPDSGVATNTTANMVFKHRGNVVHSLSGDRSSASPQIEFPGTFTHQIAGGSGPFAAGTPSVLGGLGAGNWAYATVNFSLSATLSQGTGPWGIGYTVTIAP